MVVVFTLTLILNETVLGVMIALVSLMSSYPSRMERFLYLVSGGNVAVLFMLILRLIGQESVLLYRFLIIQLSSLRQPADISVDTHVTSPHSKSMTPGIDVPPAFKHWTTGQKALMALFPWVGSAKNILRIETVDYRLQVFLNYTLSALTGVRDESTSLRLMTLQNRMVLDQLTASQGGVCAMVGEYCCKFIPENDAVGHMIADGIANLTALQKAMIKDQHAVSDGWFEWFFSSWKALLFKLGVLLLFFLILVPCIVPLLRRMVANMFSAHMVSYT